MIQHNEMMMGPKNALQTPGWTEISLPYKENRNEEELEVDPEYHGPMPCWEIWDWLEATVPDMHDEENGGVAWWHTAKIFQFFFRDKKTAALFHLRFGGELFVI